MNQYSEILINIFVSRFLEEPITFESYHTLKKDFEGFEPDEKEAILLDILFYFKLKNEQKGGDKECVKE
jgi:hypothetical protein